MTCRALPKGTADDRLLIEPLREAGLGAVFVSWDDRRTDWGAFQAVVLRSAWDYHVRTSRFLQWVEGCSAAGGRLWNPPAVIRWNHHKRYLRTLEERGVSVVPTEWLARGSDPDLADVVRRRGWSRAVLKPAVSASARRTRIVGGDVTEADRRALRASLRAADVMLQPFLERVTHEGEWSLVFLGGRFSHAVLKRPAPGDFRVQESFGGTSLPVSPPAALVESARRALEVVDGDLLYARVDGVRDSDGLRVIELELIEPSLFLSHDGGAPARFVEALSARIRGPGGG
ncbi:MAG: RimK family alpha-L-glutamate ligase [Gemmatimonadota bacterium]